MDKYNWKLWFSNVEDVESVIYYIKNHTILDIPHIFFINGPPSTGKKTFSKILENIIQYQQLNISIINAVDYNIITHNIIENSNINAKLYFVIGCSYLNDFINTNYTCSTIIFSQQFIINPRIWSESWLKYCENTLLEDLNIEYEFILPSPATRQSSCESYFITSPVISRQTSYITD